MSRRSRRSKRPGEEAEIAAHVAALRAKIRSLGEDQGVSAELAGIPASTWSKWRKNAPLNPTLGTLHKIAQVLGVGLADLFGDIDEAVARLPPRPTPPVNGGGGPDPRSVAAALRKLERVDQAIAEVRDLLAAPETPTQGASAASQGRTLERRRKGSRRKGTGAG